MKINWLTSTNAKETKIGTLFVWFKKIFYSFLKLNIFFLKKILSKLFQILNSNKEKCNKSILFNFLVNILLVLIIWVKFSIILEKTEGIISILFMFIGFYTYGLFLKYKNNFYNNIVIDSLIYLVLNLLFILILSYYMFNFCFVVINLCYFNLFEDYPLYNFNLLPEDNIESESNSSKSNTSSSSNELLIKKINENNEAVYEFKGKTKENNLVEGLHTLAKGLPEAGAASAAGALGKAIIHNTPSLPPVQRGMLGIATTSISYGVMKGIGTLVDLKKNQDKSEVIYEALPLGKKLSNTTHNLSEGSNKDFNTTNKVVEDINNNGINSLLERGETNVNDNPLLLLLTTQLTMNIYMLVTIIVLIILILNIIMYKTNSNFILNAVNKIVNDKYKIKFMKISEKLLIHYNKFSIKYLVILTIINCIHLIIIVIFNIYVNIELIDNLDYYVEVYNYIKNKNK